MRFYLGTHEVHWLGRTEVPLFVSHRRLAKRKTFPRALGPWALDSGGFTELSTYQRWTVAPSDYIAAVRRYRDEIGRLEWAAPQDWMCEPWIVEGTGLTVRGHQERTVDNLLELRAIAPDLPIIPVLQGWELGDYLSCIDLYAQAGVDLASEPVVGIGSVCRRQSTAEIEWICSRLWSEGLSLHGFGVKTRGLSRYGWALASADSMAWSYAGRQTKLPDCSHKSCQNCLPFAMRWRDRVLTNLDGVQQMMLPM